MKVKKIRTQADAVDAIHWREQYAAAADHLKSSPEPFGTNPELWRLQAEACRSMVEQFDEAIAAWRKSRG